MTRGCEALEVTPLRDGVGQPGFLMNEEGFVTELQRFCYAESGGLQLWARVVRLCGHSLVHLSPEERTRLLRTAHKIDLSAVASSASSSQTILFASAFHGNIKSFFFSFPFSIFKTHTIELLFTYAAFLLDQPPAPRFP